MMRPAQWLRLYPRAWRERYGDEFLATIEPGSLRLPQIADIVSGAIDAWLSADVRRVTDEARIADTKGTTMTVRAWLDCGRTPDGVTPRDGLTGAAVMLAAALLFRLAATAAAASGTAQTAEFFRGLAFPVSFTLSMPWWLMKGQPGKAQAAIVGATLAILVLIQFV